MARATAIPILFSNCSTCCPRTRRAGSEAAGSSHSFALVSQSSALTIFTALECARLAHGDAVAAARFATARFLGGQYWRSTAQYGNPRGGPGGVTLRRGRKY